MARAFGPAGALESLEAWDERAIGQLSSRFNSQISNYLGLEQGVDTENDFRVAATGETNQRLARGIAFEIV